MTHSNIKKAKDLIGGVMCINHALGKYHANVTFSGLLERLDISIYDEDSKLNKLYCFDLNDPDIEFSLNLCMAEIDTMAVEEIKEDRICR